ncbi:hypothetical protein [Paenibacillus cellulositrophicus]|uniref:hypothetical protein n=1 Tax=Paenibacillus cellulositrophicus TaxID=562959 RepID=UPI00126754E1|nr:hypothetical protein [Paenibacillus cellulositrophicus]
MTVRQSVLQFLLEPLRLVTWGFRFYFTHIVLMTLAIVPSAIRGYQMYTGNKPESLETILWILRIALFAAIVVIGWKERDKIRWGKLSLLKASEIIVTAGWLYLWFEYAIIPGLKLATEWISSEAAIGWSVHLFGATEVNVQDLSNAVLFVLKNMFVIPMYVMFLLRIVKVI